MDRKWDLKALYQSFEDDDFIKDLKEIEIKLIDLKKYPNLSRTTENLIDYLKEANIISEIIEKLSAFVSLTISCDTINLQALKYASLIENLLASFADTNANIQKWIASFNNFDYKNDYIQEHLFILNEIKSQNKYLLTEQSESVLANMKATGSSAWLTYKDQLISSLKVSINKKQYLLTEVLNMAYSKDKEIRKSAYEAEKLAYSQIEQGVASALNAIKGESITISKLRGYDSVLDRTLFDSRMSKKTLDVLLKTMKEALPLFQNYFKVKASHLGYKNGLPWYDLYAPISDFDSEYSFKDGSDFVIKQFGTFSKTLGDYAKKAVDNNWIDVYPRAGKVGGAFCNNLHSISESRFLLNYGNDFNDVITLAHELGHGFHGYCLNQESALNSNYPMPIAETASTFCEIIVKKAALKAASKEEQLIILENELSGCAQIIVDIYSRFLFESRLIKKRSEEGPLSVAEINDLMIEAQKEAYGTGLDHDYLHPYMWTWKPHYYEVDGAFYNFPYAFGLLLAKGLYGLYQNKGTDFIEIYETFLSLTGKMSLEDVGAQVGINIQDEKFWNNSIKSIKEDLELFFELLEDVTK